MRDPRCIPGSPLVAGGCITAAAATVVHPAKGPSRRSPTEPRHRPIIDHSLLAQRLDDIDPRLGLRDALIAPEVIQAGTLEHPLSSSEVHPEWRAVTPSRYATETLGRLRCAYLDHCHKRHVAYSLRHNMKDLLVTAGVPQRDEHRILGHSLGGVGDRVYGGGEARLPLPIRAGMPFP